MSSADVVTPKRSPICWRAGVAPTMYPVLRSCDVAPATAAATQTTPPIVSASTRCSTPVHPIARKISAVSSTVATVIPEIGFDDAPICPVMRLETVTNRNAKPTASTAAKMLIEICGSAIIADRARQNAHEHDGHRQSRSVRGRAIPLERSPDERRKPPTSADMIVGMERSRLMIPAAVTAPAPM